MKKRCPLCNKRKTLSEFYPDKTHPLGVQWCCKICSKTYTKTRYQNEKKTRPLYYLFIPRRTRALAKGIPFTITYQDLPQPFPKVCPILGIKLDYAATSAQPASPSLDRIKSKKGYVPGNVQIISHRANTIKSDATPQEIMKVAIFLLTQQQKKAKLKITK